MLAEYVSGARSTHTYTHAHTHTYTHVHTHACSYSHSHSCSYSHSNSEPSRVHPAQQSGGASAETFISGRLAEQVSGAG